MEKEESATQKEAKPAKNTKKMTKQEKSKLHEGHRERLRDRFINEGFQNFEDHNILEMVLFFTISRHDTNETAHLLLNKFGSLSGVFEASIPDLIEVDGIGPQSAFLISMIPQICNRYMVDIALRHKIRGLEQIAAFAATCLIGMSTEHFMLFCVDNKQTLLSHHFISEGDVDSSSVNMRKIIQILMSSNATAAVIAHNHPRGGTTPSRADLMTTLSIARSLQPLHVRLLDHVVVCPEEYLSMASDPKKYGCYLNPC